MKSLTRSGGLRESELSSGGTPHVAVDTSSRQQTTHSRHHGRASLTPLITTFHARQCSQ
jgi:hypothetical protein